MFGGLGNLFRGNDGNNCMCTIVWIILLMQICGCEMPNFLCNIDCKEIILLLLLLSCCGCGERTPCGN